MNEIAVLEALSERLEMQQITYKVLSESIQAMFDAVDELEARIKGETNDRS